MDTTDFDVTAWLGPVADEMTADEISDFEGRATDYLASVADSNDEDDDREATNAELREILAQVRGTSHVGTDSGMIQTAEGEWVEANP